MATEYKCDICGEPATVHITKIIDGKKIKIHLCAACAQKASFEAMNLPAEVFPKIQELEKQMASPSKKKADVCLTCGSALAEIESGARFSCPDCYAAMGSRLFDLFSQMHGATAHTGKLPKKHSPNCCDDTLSQTVDDIERILSKSNSDFLEDAKKLAENLQPKLSKLKGESADCGDCEGDDDCHCHHASVGKETKESLQGKLNAAISEERYEDAAKLRDELKSFS